MSDRRAQSRYPDDPSGIEEPHDVLAAEEFAMPIRGPGTVPADPTGIREAHDVLAAEEFAMPTPRAAGQGLGSAERGERLRWPAMAGAFIAGLLVAWALRRRP